MGLRRALVVVQIAMSFVLLITAGLTIRSLRHTERLGPGFDPSDSVTLSVDPGLQGYDENKGQNFYRQVIERVSGLPGVKSAAWIRSLPLGLDTSTTAVYPDGQPQPSAENMPSAIYESISPGYFDAMGITLVAGRDVALTDTEKSPKVVIVNETLAERFWPGENPVGKRLCWGVNSEAQLEVIGVAKSGKYQSLGEIPALAIYYPMSQVYSTSAALVARTTTDPASTISTIRGEIRKLDPNLPVYDAKTLKEHMQLPLFPLRAAAVAVGSFALLATVLAATGIYGVMAYSVEQRRQEIGIRMALGASAIDVWRLVLRQGVTLTIIGMLLGLICSAALSKVVANLLYGVSAIDPQTFIVISVLLAAVAMIACFLPARRATTVDPVAAIKSL